MALEQKRALCSIVQNFALCDIEDRDGNVVLTAGQPKRPSVHYAEWIEQDGVMREETLRRVEATDDDLRDDPALIQRPEVAAYINTLEIES